VNEAPGKFFGMILQRVETDMATLLPENVDELTHLATMQHAVATCTVLSLVPLCAGSCEGCHETARGVIILSGAAIRAIEQRVLELMATPEHAVVVADFMAGLRDRFESIGTNPGALSHEELVELGVVESEDEP